MGRTRSVNTKKRLGKLSEVQMSKISISQILCSAKFHFPYFSKFKFSGTQKTHFREYPFSRIPILSVVKDFELKNPFSRKPIFARIDCTQYTPLGFIRMTQIWQIFPAASGGREKSGIWGSQNAILQGKSAILRVSKPQNFPAAEGGRKNRYFGPSKSSFLGGKTVRKRSQTEPI